MSAADETRSRTSSSGRAGGLDMNVRAPGGYTARSVLGEGFVGTTVLCRDQSSGQDVVICIVRDTPWEEVPRKALESELSAAAAASRHPCALPIDAVWCDERVGICLRLHHSTGGSAQARLEQGTTWATDEVILAGIRACGVLAFSHSRGVLHLDVRPANLFADGNGEWSLAAGGVSSAVARVLARPDLPFDPRYASRELLGWEHPAPATDVFGLGATLYALLSGSPPETPARTRPPARPGLPPVLCDLIDRMLADDPSARPRLAEVERVLRGQLTVNAVPRAPATDLAPAVKNVPLPVRRLNAFVPNPVADDTDRRRRRTLMIAGGVAVAFVAASIATVATLDSDDARPVVQATALGPQEVSPEVLVDRAPRTVKLQLVPDGFVVLWVPPRNADRVSGYLVAITDSREVLWRGFAAPGQLHMVVPAPPLTAQSCVTVSTLVDGGEEGIRSAPADPNCDDVKAFADKFADDGMVPPVVPDRDPAAPVSAPKATNPAPKKPSSARSPSAATSTRTGGTKEAKQTRENLVKIFNG